MLGEEAQFLCTKPVNYGVGALCVEDKGASWPFVWPSCMTGYDAVPAALVLRLRPHGFHVPRAHQHVCLCCVQHQQLAQTMRVPVCARELGIEIRVRAQSTEAFMDCAMSVVC